MKKKLKKFVSIEYFIPNVLIPLLILAVYSGSFAVVYNKFFLEGINSFFAGLLFILLLPFLIILMVIYIPLIIKKKSQKGNILLFDDFVEHSWSCDFLIILLPLTPVIQYLLNNLEILSLVDGLYVVSFFVLFCGLHIYAFPFIFRKISPIRTITAIGLSFVYTITSMPSLSQEFNWYVESKIFIPLIFFGGILFVTWILSKKKFQKVFHIFIMINLLVNSSIQLISKYVGDDNNNPSSVFEKNELFSLIDDELPSTTPNIYFLVYESYVPNETMRGYGIENSSHEKYLRDQGFVIYPNVYSVGSPSIESLSRVFNVSTEYYGKKRRAVSGDGVVQNILKKLGYKSYGITASDWVFRGTGSSYDYSFPETEQLASYELLSLAILHGELSFDLIFKNVSHKQYIETKQTYLRKNFNNPLFIYSHSDLPGHASSLDFSNPEEMETYKENLSNANLEMKKDIQDILGKNQGSIIVIAGDHGPYLIDHCSKDQNEKEVCDINRMYIQDRFATFLAIKWPNENYKKYDDIRVLQDLFPVIFAYMYNDKEILESRIEPNIIDINLINGVLVNGRMIYGGIDDGEPLFISNK